MKTEIEIKVLEIDVKKVVTRLRELDAEFVGLFGQRRFTYDINPKTENKWIRLRTDGFRTTLCFKSIESDKIDGTKEVEFEVPDFAAANEFLECIGIPSKQYQENRRSKYMIDGVEVDIDHWPLIPPYLEIEGQSEQEVMDTIKKLGLEDGKITSLNTQDVYKKYGIDLTKIKDLRF